MDTKEQANSPQNNFSLKTEISAKFVSSLDPTPKDQMQLAVLNENLAEITETLQPIFQSLLIDMLDLKMRPAPVMTCTKAKQCWVDAGANGGPDDTCLVDEGVPHDCKYGESVARRGGKEHCEHWRHEKEGGANEAS